MIEGMRYVPERLEVVPGERVLFVNNDVVPHTVTAAAAGIESGEIAAGKSWTWRVAGTGTAGAGEIAYLCRFHPGMRAVLVVRKP